MDKNIDSNNSKGGKPSDDESPLSQTEYKLVPIEEVESINDEEVPIDFIAELRRLWDERFSILKVVISIIAIGCILYVFGEQNYSASITLMPESQSQESGTSRILQQYGGLIGVGGSGTGVSDAISVDLYPEIIVSTPFQVELVQESLNYSKYDTTVSIYTYYHQYREKPPFEKAGDFIWNMTIGLPGTLTQVFSSSGKNEAKDLEVDFEKYEDKDGPLNLDGKISKAINHINERISVQRQPQTGFVIINAEYTDPHATAGLVKAVKKLLTGYVTEYKTEKAKEDLAYIKEQYEIAKNRYESSQDSLAEFLDQNKNLATAQARNKEERLQSENNLRFQVYNSLAERLERAKLNVQEETPVFSTLEPVSIPGSPSSPDLFRIMLGSIFLGLFLGIIYIYIKRFIFYFINEFKTRSGI